MIAPPPPLRWWGWGDRDTAIPPGLAALLRAELRLEVGSTTAQAPPPPTLPSTRASADLLAALRAASGDDAVDTGDETRLLHAAGRSYLDLVRLRSADVGEVPDAVVTPRTTDAVAAVLRACVAGHCAVVPFGGGTSVVGGVTPLRGDQECVIALSTRRLNSLIHVDPVSMVATLGAGMTGPEAEAALAARGLTLGHLPQSFEYATIGGFAATRSSGQASSGYGRFDELVLGLRCVAPSGEMVVTAHPATAAGPSIRQLLLGSEGRLGVITEATVRVRRRPGASRYEAWSFPSFATGVAALRALAQSRLTPDVARLADAEETRVGMAMAAHGGFVEAAGHRYLRARGHTDACLLVLGWECDAAAVRARQWAARRVVRRHGGITLGTSPGNAWLRGRFGAPYLRDSLLDAGVLVETLETATRWSNLERLRTAVVDTLRAVLAEAGTPPLVGCHVSHVYPSGGSLYFTVLARPGADPSARWRGAKQAACDAILDAGGTITHHHAVGTDHRPYLEREVGPEAVVALRALATAVDPAGVMNPGKLLPD